MKIVLDIPLTDSIVVINALESVYGDSERNPVDRLIASRYADMIRQQAVEYIKNRGSLDDLVCK